MFSPRKAPAAHHRADLDIDLDDHSQVMLLGDVGVGKTCMMIKFKDGHFLGGTYISTVGIDYRVSWASGRLRAVGMYFLNGRSVSRFYGHVHNK